MRRSSSTSAVLGAAIAVVVAVVGFRLRAGEASGGRKAAPARRSDAQPDLQGIWGFATVTPLQRPKEFAGKDVLTAEEKAKLEEQAVRDQFVDRPPPPGNPGTYNRFWVDAGTKVVATGRTSLIVDPPDGRVPPLTAQGQERQAALDARAKAAAGPEDLTTWDRCILGFNAGPPMIGGGYNAYVQLVQTSDYVVLLTEMVHDARIIPLNGRPPLPRNIRQWRGDSTRPLGRRHAGRRDEELPERRTGTLSLRGLGFSGDENLHLTERFRRLDADTLVYEYTVDDPTIWTRPWTVSMTMEKTDEPIYEYACHEGNYGMRGILSGARADKVRERGGGEAGRRQVGHQRREERWQTSVNTVRGSGSIGRRCLRASAGPQGHARSALRQED